MSRDKYSSKSDFVLEGRFLGFALQDGYKLKYLRLATATNEHVIKIDKELRSTLWRTLVPGAWIQVAGYQKQCEKRDTVKLKAYEVKAVALGSTMSPAASCVDNLPEGPKEASKCSILVCQKSDCCKRGGNAISKALEAALSDRQLTDKVTIKPTGCMKRCKAGPNIVMPDKTRYSGISPTTIPTLIDKHFCEERIKVEG